MTTLLVTKVTLVGMLKRWIGEKLVVLSSKCQGRPWRLLELGPKQTSHVHRNKPWPWMKNRLPRSTVLQVPGRAPREEKEHHKQRLETRFPGQERERSIESVKRWRREQIKAWRTMDPLAELHEGHHGYYATRIDGIKLGRFHILFDKKVVKSERDSSFVDWLHGSNVTLSENE